MEEYEKEEMIGVAVTLCTTLRKLGNHIFVELPDQLKYYFFPQKRMKQYNSSPLERNTEVSTFLNMYYISESSENQSFSGLLV